jgi:hypothetical protein
MWEELRAQKVGWNIKLASEDLSIISNSGQIYFLKLAHMSICLC